MIRTLLVSIMMLLATEGISQKITVRNDATKAARKGYFNWKIYLVAPPDVLRTISQVVYTLHPSFPNSVQTVNASSGNPAFSYSSSGWGEFDIKVKVVFTDRKRPPLYLVHHLNLSGKK